MTKDPQFAETSEKHITRAILRSFSEQLDEICDSEVIIVGAGPSGLLAARDLAIEGRDVTIVERNNYLGGGFWLGGYLMNKLTVRAPAHEILDELDIPCEQTEPGLYVADGPHACSKLISATCEAGARVLNMTSCQDVVLREGRVGGVVINWTPVEELPRQITCVDPVAIEGEVVVDATGHDARVAGRLRELGLINFGSHDGMWVDASEDAVVAQTAEVYRGVYACGMAVATIRGLPRMGPTFGAMLVSGRTVAILIDQHLTGKAEVAADQIDTAAVPAK